MKIGKFCQLINGKAFKQSEWTESGYPIIRIQNLNDITKSFNYYSRKIDDRYIVHNGDLLFSWSGTPGTSFGAFIWNRGKAVLNQHIYMIKSNEKISDKKFLKLILNYEINKIIFKSHGGVGLKHITKKDLENIDLFLPPLEDQIRIASVLTRAEKLITKRKESIRLLDELLKSTFLEMFGDPVRNEKGWEKYRFDDLVLKIESGKSPKCESYPATKNKWGVLKLSAITSCEYKQNENKELPDNIRPHIQSEVKKGDVLFSRKNTYDLVAACSYVFETGDKLLLSDLIFRFVIRDQKELSPIFLWQLFVNSSQRKATQKLAGGAAGSMPNISKGNLLRTSIIVPTMDLQLQFVEVVNKVEFMKSQFIDSLSELENLYGSLSQKAFKGELDLSTIPTNT